MAYKTLIKSLKPKFDFSAIGLYMIVFLLSTTLAKADSIDGTWCKDTEQKMMTINGSQLIIDRFVSTGQYSRHSFIADWPIQSLSDPDTGSRVQMRLHDEMNLRLVKIRPNGENTQAENWHRCQPVT